MKTVEENTVKGLGSGEKYALTLREAGEYFNIGVKKMNRLAREHLGDFAIMNGNRYLIIRTKFEEFMAKSSTV